MKLIEYWVKNPLLVNLLMIAIFLLGGQALFELPRELMPKVAFNYVFVIVPYPGVSAEEIEKILVTEVEDAVDDVDDIKLLTSEANEGSAFIWLQFEEIGEATFKERMNEVETAVNQLDLPDGTLEPTIMEFSSEDFIPLISVSILGDLTERKIEALATDLEEDLLDIDGVGKVSITGVREREIWVEVKPRKLTQHNLSLSQVAQAVSSKNMNIPAGDVTIGKHSYLVRTVGEIETPQGLEKIVVRWDPMGNHLYLGQIAQVKDTWKELATTARINGKPSATLSVSRKAEASTLEIIEEVKKVAESYRSELPPNSQILFTNDTSIWMKDILGKLESNAQLGFLLVILILFVFLGLRNAFVAGIGIPIAFFATFIMMKHLGQTFNGSSLFGLMLVLGIVVDDAIIVIENCYRHRHRGLAHRDAAIKGASEVFWPVITATLTTIAAFSPLILMSGIMGKFMRVIPIVVSLTLLASMIEVFLIAPSHYAEWGGKGKEDTGRWFRMLRLHYTRFLTKMIRIRYLIGPAILILAIILGIGMYYLVGVEMFAGDEFSQFWVIVTMPPGTKLAETDEVIKEMEAIANNLPEGEVHAVIANAGFAQDEADWIYADHIGMVIVDVVEPNFRTRSMDAIMDDMRQKANRVEGPIRIKLFKDSGGPPTGKPVEIKVKGPYLEELQQVAEEVKTVLREIPGTRDVGDDNLPGKREISLVVDEDKAAYYGLNVAMIANEVRTAVTGVEASIFRDGDEEVDIRVKLKDGDKLGYKGLSALNIMTPTGQQIRLNNLVRFEEKPTRFRIKRFEKERAITVSAEIDAAQTDAVKVNQEVIRRFKDISVRHPGYRLDFRGEFMEFQNAFIELGQLFIVGVIMIFVILGAQFKSISQSLIILLTIPFAFIGSMIGLLVGGNPFSMGTMYAMVALAGIAVNDAIVMITFINNNRKRGGNKWRSIIEGGRVRLRPVILTSVTTILGLLPMALGLGGKSASWGPFASTIVWGLAVATLLTLFVIPTVYSIAVDDKFGFRPVKERLFRKRIEA